MNAITSLSGLLAQRRQWPLTRQRIGAPLGLLRAQIATLATATAADGLTHQEHGADVPRFNGPTRRLMVEGQRGNAIRNPRGESTALYWHVTSAAGVTATSSTVTEAGATAMRWQFAGTPTATSSCIIYFDGVLNIAAAPGQTWAASARARISAGTLANVTPTFGVVERNGTGAGLVFDTSVAALTGDYALVSRVRTLSNASTSYIQAGFIFGVTNGLPVDFTISIILPQLELGAFPSTPILPSPGAPAASTRAADQVTAGLAALGLGDGEAFTLLGTAMLPHPGGAVAQTLLQIDDGSANNRVLLDNSGGLNLRLFRATAGASSFNGAAATIAAGVPFRFGLSKDALGRVALSVDGAPVVALTGAPAGGLATLRIGANSSGGGPMFGEIGPLAVLPWALPDAALAAQVLALPL